MTPLNPLEFAAILVAALVLIATGFLLVLLGALSTAGTGDRRSRGIVVLLLGPIPLVVRGGARVTLVAFLLAAAALLLFLYALLS
ncbi:MAG: hypothetical protein QXO17_00740 [Nitrososphaerota archaeon]